MDLKLFHFFIIAFQFFIVAILSYQIFTFNTQLNQEFSSIFLILFIFIFGNILIIYFLKKKIYEPIDNLTNMIENFKDFGVGETGKIFYNDEIGTMTNEFFIMQNILQRKTQDLKKSKQELESATNALSDAIYYKDLTLNYTWVNDSFCKLMNLPRSEILGKNDFDLFEKEISIQSTFLESKLMEDEEDVYFENETTSHFGTTIYLASKKYLLKDSKGKAYAIAGTISDITAQKETEIEILKQKDFIQALIDSQEQLIITTDNHKIISANETFLDFFALSCVDDFQDEYDTNSIGDLFNKDAPKSYLQNKVYNEDWIDYVISRSYSNKTDKVMITRGNTNFIFSVTAAKLPGKGNIKSAVFTDITELELTKEKALQAEISAQKANNSKSEFLANMSHEIRTPMNAIIGFSELLYEQIEDTHLKQFTKTIQSAGQTLLELINDILDISKIEAGKLDITPKPTNPYNLIEETANIFSLKMQEKGLDILIDIDKTIPKTIIIDEIRIRQILLNLIGNAIKFTSSGYIKISAKPIKIDEMSSTVDLSISVEDTGIGIKENQIGKIFESFTQHDGQDNKEYGGTGLGLTISTKLAKMMNGSLKVTSIYGKGSIFELRLHNISISSIVVEKEQKELATHYKFDKATILLVDDIENNRELVKHIFKDTDITILTANNGKIAIELATTKDIDLILMDIRMPIIDGYQAADIIRKTKQDLPIIALTASVMEDDFNKIRRSNFNGYLRKPILKSKLFDEISKYLTYTNKKEESSQEVERVLSLKTKENLESILDKLNGEIHIIFEKVQKSNNMNDAKNFATLLSELANDYEIEHLQEYAEALIKAIDIFDIMGMKKLLNQYEKNIYLLTLG